MQFVQETEHERALRRIQACTHTLYSVAEELEDPIDINHRADLLIAVENLFDIASFVTDAGRGIAWQHSPVPESEDDED